MTEGLDVYFVDDYKMIFELAFGYGKQQDWENSEATEGNSSTDWSRGWVVSGISPREGSIEEEHWLEASDSQMV